LASKNSTVTISNLTVAREVSDQKQRDALLAMSRQLTTLADQVEIAFKAGGFPETFLGRKTFEPFPTETE
jgi:hypothetical protein